jgi:uncharacterized membrane protein
LAGLGIGFAVLYPLAAERALGLWGARAVGVALCGAGLVSLVALQRGRVPMPPLWLRAAGLALPLGAALSGDAVFLRLIPAAIQFGVVAVFLASLRGGGSLFQDVARIIEPHAPEFIASYCRKTTLVFAAIFALQGVAVGLLALRPGQEGWAFASGVLIWTPVLVGFAVEWVVRKTWFRNWGDGPLDRRLRRLFPPENTPAGRRSLEFIRRRRSELGMPPP